MPWKKRLSPCHEPRGNTADAQRQSGAAWDRFGLARGLLSCLLITSAPGCGGTVPDNYAKGPVDPSLHDDAKLVNEQRLAGEDHRVQPLYATPLKAIDVGYDTAIADPLTRLLDYLQHDTPGVAARKMLDASSADNRRAGSLRMSDFEFARQSKDQAIVWANIARTDPDYTVRAAAIRALNRARATGYTSVFQRALDDDQVLVRLEAADALGNIPDPVMIDPLIIHLQHEVSSDVRIACAEALRNFRSFPVVRALIDAMDGSDSPIGWDFAVAWQARQSLALITGQDFRYDRQAWLGYLGDMKF